MEDFQDYFQNKKLIQAIIRESRGGSLKIASFGKNEVLYSVKKIRSFTLAELLPMGLYFPSEIPITIKMVERLLEENAYSQITINENPLSSNLKSIKPDLVRHKFKTINRSAHILFLDQDLDTIFRNRFNATRQKHIKRYQKNADLHVFSTSSPEYFDKYYSIYKDSLDRWNKKHKGYSKTFFNDLVQIENLKLWVAEYKGEMIAGMITLYNKEGVFDWLAAALLNEKYKKIYGAVAVQYEVIKHAVENNYKYVNMGASLDLGGVKNFKDTWGAETVNYHSFVYTKTSLKLLLYVRRLLKKI